MNHQAIYNTHPNVVSVDDGEGAFDAQGNLVVIDQAAYDAEVARLEAEHNATQYQRDRKAEYPAIEELIVALAEFQEGRPEMWYEVTRKRTEVKAKYPKP